MAKRLLKAAAFFVGPLLALYFAPAWGWNAAGHEMIAEMAYPHLLPATKKNMGDLLSKGQALSLAQFKNAAVWLDNSSNRREPSLRKLHYINWSFSEDGTALPLIEVPNAETAIKTALHVLKSPKSSRKEKKKWLKILIHVYQDIHQPLHTASRVSKSFPEGDRGGNLTPVYGTKIARNLHEYWDRGGGLTAKPVKKQTHSTVASYIGEKYPCLPLETDGLAVLQESHSLAIQYVYGMLPLSLDITPGYQSMTIALSMQQLAVAGCRLSQLLNQTFTS